MIVKLADEDVRIVKLEPLRVATFHAMGAIPEKEAWNRLYVWAEDNGEVNVCESRFFGFVNPPPGRGTSWHGYDACMTVNNNVSGGNGITIRQFEGGEYAVTRTILWSIRETWQSLIEWNVLKGHGLGKSHMLEEHLSLWGTPLDDYIVDLYLPVIVNSVMVKKDCYAEF